MSLLEIPYLYTTKTQTMCIVWRQRIMPVLTGNGEGSNIIFFFKNSCRFCFSEKDYTQWFMCRRTGKLLWDQCSWKNREGQGEGQVECWWHYRRDINWTHRMQWNWYALANQTKVKSGTLCLKTGHGLARRMGTREWSGYLDTGSF